MIAVVFALLALLGWAVGDVFTAYASRKIGSYNASFYGYLFGTLAFSLYIPFALNALPNLDLGTIILVIILSFFQVVAFVSYNEALKIGSSSIVGTIAGTFTSLVVVLSVIFLNERLFSTQILAIVIIFIGLVLTSLNIKDLKSKTAILNRGTALAFVAMIGWAIYFTFIKIPVAKAGFFWPTYLTSLSGLLFLLYGFKRIKRPSRKLKRGFLAVFFSGTLLTIGSFSFNIGITKGLSSVVAPISGAYPALFALLAYLLFKDPVNRRQKQGMVITLIGIILLAYFSR